MPGGPSPRLSYGAVSGGHSSRVSVQVPLLYRVTSTIKKRQLATAMSSVGAPLSSSMVGYPFWRQRNKQGQLPGSECATCPYGCSWQH